MNGMPQQIAVRKIRALSLDVLGEVIGLSPCYFDNCTARDARRHHKCKCCKPHAYEYPWHSPWAHECWTAGTAQRGTGLRAIIFAPIGGATFVSPRFYRGGLCNPVRGKENTEAQRRGAIIQPPRC